MKELEGVELQTTLHFKDKIVKLYWNSNGYGTPNRNIICEELDGNLIWQVDDISSNNMCAFVEIKALEGVRLQAYNWCGYLCEIDLSDGKILSALLTK